MRKEPNRFETEKQLKELVLFLLRSRNVAEGRRFATVLEQNALMLRGKFKGDSLLNSEEEEQDKARDNKIHVFTGNAEVTKCGKPLVDGIEAWNGSSARDYDEEEAERLCKECMRAARQELEAI